MYNKSMIECAVATYLQTSTLSQNTKTLYRRYLLEFLWWAIDQGESVPDANAATVARWFAKHPEWSASTRHSATAALREFYKFQFGANHAMTLVKVRRVVAPPQRTLTEEEVATLLGVCDTTTEKGIRDLAIITMMVDTGLRASEVCDIELRRVDLRKNSLQVICKGGEWGVANFFDYTASCLLRWLAVRPLVADPDNLYFFVSIGGKAPGGKMTRYGIRSILQSLSVKANLDPVSPHAMRRTFATLATENGSPTRLVQAAGRWKSIRMVEHYTRKVHPEKIRPYSPINHIMGVKSPEDPADSNP